MQVLATAGNTARVGAVKRVMVLVIPQERGSIMRKWVVGICMSLAIGAGFAQNEEATRANALFKAGKRPEALPLYEDLAKAYPNEQLYAERLADCLSAESAQLTDPAEIKAVRIRERDAAKRAIELGDTAEFIRQMASLDPDQPLYSGIVSPGKSLLAEAEKAYAAGDFRTAMTEYEAAAEVDPHLYEAALYAGDTAYVQQDLATAAPWFVRAIEIDPNRETAYRYWGDAILKLGGDPAFAKEKFIDAVVAEPYSKYAWQGLRQWAGIEKATILTPKMDIPGNVTVDRKDPKNITINIDSEATDDAKHPGSSAWVIYPMARANYRNDQFKKDHPIEKKYRHSLQEEKYALGVVVATVKERKIKPKDLDESLRNLVELSDAGMLECGILISGADEGIAQDYDAYRNQHRQLLHDYIERFVVHGGTPPVQ
ncbi:MAG: tetratricopeptide repeat protein [Terracidiphilus sp.]